MEHLCRREKERGGKRREKIKEQSESGEGVSWIPQERTGSKRSEQLCQTQLRCLPWGKEVTGDHDEKSFRSGEWGREKVEE